MFYEEEISEYIKAHTVVSEEELELKYAELFGEGLTDLQICRKKQLQNQPPQYIIREEALEKLKQENLEEIENLRSNYCDNKLRDYLQYYCREGFIWVCHSPKEFVVKLDDTLSEQKILKGNTKLLNRSDGDGFYDFNVNEVQIATRLSTLGSFIQIYIPDKEYPVGMTRRKFLSREKELELKFIGEFKNLCEKYQEQEQGLDVSAISKKFNLFDSKSLVLVPAD